MAVAMNEVVGPTDLGAKEVCDALFAFIDREVAKIQQPIEAALHNPRLYWREDGRIADEVVQARRAARMASAEAGFYTMFCPSELGGGGLRAELYFEVFEALCHRYGSPQTQLAFQVLAHASTGPTALWTYASDALKADLVPKLMRGEVQGSFAMSEPDAGSDAWMMTTTAVHDGDYWVLNGTKQWASWAPTADFLITFAITDRERFAARKGGLTGFYVPTDVPGYDLYSIVKVFDEIGGEEAILTFNDVRIPDQYRLGEVGEGFRVAMEGSGLLKMTKLARLIGLGRWANDKAADYAKVRKTFGKTLSEHQSIQNMLADNCMDIYTSRLASLDVARKHDAGDQARFESAMSHVLVAEAMYRVYDRSMQILGGIGLSNEAAMIHGWHTTRVSRISEGPPEVQRRTIAKYLLSGAYKF
ncbi:acyl-CoA dehydrogenase family protein [Mycobacterium paraseoulense]|nr:acyl-CoA dehydrogenase family protein [Mycobacterium paraseoulense]MCV7398073.1 acyl-CoA dehydrogenase family protein [Mycobacterium paraseoulense]BBZ70775.1 acyl-CoA dehydrogenase [Mycobacterium paraseoulense]